MSRSVHTDPKRIRAPRRTRSPYAPRHQGDQTSRNAILRTLRSMGIASEMMSEMDINRAVPLPRITIKRAIKDHRHVLTRHDIIAALEFFGEACSYGLRTIELAAIPPVRDGKLLFGQLLVPGQIVLFPQPPTPWCLAGQMSNKQRRKMTKAGAILEVVAAGAQTTVQWPDRTLHDFMLFDVLMHEIGHHLLQQYKGKRNVQTARTKDHEQYAERFAKRCQKIWSEADAHST